MGLVGQRHLQVVAATGQRTLAAQGEATVVVGIDQLVIDRRRVRQQAQPPKRVHTFEVGEHLGRDALARDAVEAIATGDVIAVDAVGLAIFLVGDVRVFALHLMGLHIHSRIDDRRVVGSASRHQVASNFGLAIDHDGLAAGQCLEVNTNALATNQQFDAVMDQAFGIHAFGHTGFAQHVDGALLQHTGTNTAEDIIRRLTFEDDVGDAGIMQQLAEQKTGRAGADNSNLSFHYSDL
ncbi:hypothetical protein D9M71_339270 [compost metagenome]